jgi:hypothetical protein
VAAFLFFILFLILIFYYNHFFFVVKKLTAHFCPAVHVFVVAFGGVSAQPASNG